MNLTYPFGSGVVRFQTEGGEFVYRVQWGGRLCRPMWKQHGPASAYLALLAVGRKQPEYVEDQPRKE